MIATPLFSCMALLVIAAGIASAAVGYILAVQSDERLNAERRTALQSAIHEYHSVLSAGTVDARTIQTFESLTGFKGLKFENEPGGADRELHSVLDPQGRIIGWFSWEQDRPAVQALARLWPVFALTALGLLGFAGLAVWLMHRASRKVAESEQRAWTLVHEDPLTGLPTHRKMLELTEQGLAQRIYAEVVVVGLIYLDGFRELNDTLGHDSGDQLVMEIAGRLKAALPPGAAAARIAGDEFGVLIHADDTAAAMAAVETAAAEISRPYGMNQAVRLSASVGVAQAPRDASTRDELNRRANLALRVAKRQGHGRIVSFAPDMEAEFHEQSFIKRELGRALAESTLDVHYQPIVAASGSRIAGVEALLRWTHPARGPISPALFVPVAERSGLMDALGAFVLRRALTEAGRWPGLYIAVNLSPLQVRDPTFVDKVARILAETGIKSERVILEITEGVLIDDPEETRLRLEALRRLGVRIALDDFGSGYSNLGYLQHLPVDKLKIDRRFVTPLGRSANGGVIIQAIVALGRALGLTIVAEGVETEEQRVLLRLAGCDEMQGFLFSQAMPVDGIDRLAGESGATRALPLTRGGAGA